MSKRWPLAGLLCCAPILACAQPSTVANAPSTIVAKQGDGVLTLSDIDAFAAGIPETDRPGFFASSKRMQTTLMNLLLQKQLAVQARKNELEKDPNVQAQMALAAEEALGKAQVEYYRKHLQLPDFSKLAREEYLAHKEKYELRGRLDVKHILISSKDRSDDEARALADKVDAEAKAHPEQFDALVEKYSDDTSKSSNHGLMHDVNVDGQYAAEFTAAAKKLKKPGEISPVVKTSFGYHVLQLDQRTDAKSRPFEEVGPDIVTQLRIEYVKKAMQDYTDGLRNNALDSNESLIESLRDRYGSLPKIPETAKKP